MCQREIWAASVVILEESHNVKKQNQLGLPFLMTAWEVYMLVVSLAWSIQMQLSHFISVLPQLWPLQREAQQGVMVQNASLSLMGFAKQVVRENFQFFTD